MHLVGLVLGSVAPARLRAFGAAPLAAPGGHSLGEDRGRGGERERGHPNGSRRWHWDIYNASDLTARCTPAKLPLTRRFVYSLAGVGREPRGPGGGGCEGGRGWERVSGRRSLAERSCTRTLGAHTRATHPGSSHAPLGHPPSGAKAARNLAPREQLSLQGLRRKRGVETWK